MSLIRIWEVIFLQFWGDLPERNCGSVYLDIYFKLEECVLGNSEAVWTYCCKKGLDAPNSRVWWQKWIKEESRMQFDTNRGTWCVFSVMINCTNKLRTFIPQWVRWNRNWTHGMYLFGLDQDNSLANLSQAHLETYAKLDCI